MWIFNYARGYGLPDWDVVASLRRDSALVTKCLVIVECVELCMLGHYYNTSVCMCSEGYSTFCVHMWRGSYNTHARA